MSIPSDIEIAQAARPRPITEVAAEIGLGADDLDLYGKYKAKVPLELSGRPARGLRDFDVRRKGVHEFSDSG